MVGESAGNALIVATPRSVLTFMMAHISALSTVHLGHSLLKELHQHVFSRFVALQRLSELIDARFQLVLRHL